MNGDFIDSRSRSKLGSPGPFVAIITNNVDPTYMGRLEVAVIKGLYPDTSQQANTYTVKYLNPFYGVTSIKFQGNNNADNKDVQKSYGMWMVPPDIGTRVLVIFVDGDPNQGYWMGSVMDNYQNHMVPGIAASDTALLSAAQENEYDTKYLPVSEFLKNDTTDKNSLDVSKFGKPVHPFADKLLKQGLLKDKVRGVTSSSARRESPSAVFGISTPGPLDKNGKQGNLGYTKNYRAPVDRLGGSTFVMDDGDSNGENELVRIRTRTGHQILMHNTKDLIYIANGQGTAWIELTGDGKIDIYARDSVSIRSEVDFNFHADRDINIEAGRNINFRAQGNFSIEAEKNFSLISGQDGKIHVKHNLDQTVEGYHKVSVQSNYDLKVGGTARQTATKDFNISSGANNNFSANANTNISTQGTHYESAKAIHMNGPVAAAAAPAEKAEIPEPITLWSLPNTDPIKFPWKGKQYKAPPIESIMQRMPTHEPWEQHEDLDRDKFNSIATDAVAGKANKKAQ